MTLTVTGISRSGDTSGVVAALAAAGFPAEPLQVVAPVGGAAQALLAERLRLLHIPGDEVDNYLEALRAGRSILAYAAEIEAADRVIEAFRGSGVVKVRVQRARTSAPASVPGRT